jgi:hypothetical protein
MSSVGSGGGEVAVGLAGQGPAAVMDHPMMGPAHQGQVGQVGRVAMEPVDQLVGLTPGQRPVTVGEPTAPVADMRSEPDRRRARSFEG